jgi:hypothetical protein
MGYSKKRKRGRGIVRRINRNCRNKNFEECSRLHKEGPNKKY